MYGRGLVLTDFDKKFRKNDAAVIEANGKIANDRSFYASPSEYPHGGETGFRVLRVKLIPWQTRP